jgi:hypothetical protein
MISFVGYWPDVVPLIAGGVLPSKVCEINFRLCSSRGTSGSPSSLVEKESDMIDGSVISYLTAEIQEV